MDPVLLVLWLVVIIPNSVAVESTAKFTSTPPNIVYVTSGNTATLTWKYSVQNRLQEFQDHSPTWHLYLPNGTSIPLAYENKYTRNWTLSDSCPSRLRDRLFIKEQNSLVIKNANLDDSVRYGCTLNLTNGVPIISRSKLIVTEGPVFQSTLDQKYVLPEGEDFSINCIAYGIPTPVVKWYKIVDGRKVLITYGSGNAELKARNTRREFNGTYECEAVNSPIAKVSNRTDILVEYRPSIDSILSSPPTINSWDNKTVLLRCMVKGNPVPQVSWTSSDKEPIKYGVSQLDGGSLLTIKTVKTEDYGQYRCEASNARGYVYRFMSINRIDVPDPPVIVKTQSTKSTIELTWRRPTLDGGSPIVDYQVIINTKPLRTVSVKATAVIIAGLNKATTYQVKLSARNIVGHGNATTTSIATKNEVDMSEGQISGAVVLGVCLPIIFILLLVIVLILVYNWWKRRKRKDACDSPLTIGSPSPGTDAELKSAQELETIKVEETNHCQSKQNGVTNSDAPHKQYNGSCFQPFIMKRQKRRPGKSKTPKPLVILDAITEENAEEENTENDNMTEENTDEGYTEEENTDDEYTEETSEHDNNDNIRNTSDVVIEPRLEEDEEEEKEEKEEEEEEEDPGTETSSVA